MPRTPSYFQHIAPRPADTLPLLQPPRVLMRRWEVAAPQDAVSEITPSLAAQRPPTANSRLEDTGAPSFQAPVRKATEQPPTPPVEKAVEVVLEAGSLTARSQKSQTEIKPTPVKPGRSLHGITPEVDQPLHAIQSKATPQAGAINEERYRSVMPTPTAKQESKVTTMANTSTKSRRSDDVRPTSDAGIKVPTRPARVTLVPQAQEKPMASPAKRDAQQRSSVHIGTIDIHIVPPPAPPIPTVPSPTARSTTARPPARPALSRELTSFVGLRQG